MDCKGNEAKCIELTNKKLKELGINKTLNQMYDKYTSVNNPRCKDFKLLKTYLNGVGITSLNPYHIYNHYYYFDGLNEVGEIVN